MPSTPPLGAGPRRYLPVLPKPIVRRARLEALLDDGQRRQITLVSGLPGAGKTTLVASWLRPTRRPAAWVGLDGRDNEPGRLARSVVAGLALVSPVAEPVPRRRRSDAAALDQAFAALTGGRWVLVLDDVHELRSPEALRTLGHLLDRAPANLSVVLCARADPPVALGRLRLEGRLGEIRNADLEFTAAEAAQLFTAYGIELGHDDMRALWLRTQGWVAGLRLAAGALGPAADRHELVRTTTATEAAVADYLLEEVLDRQEESTQSFLLRTSVVDHLSPPLAAVLSDDEQAQERLDELERNGVFLADMSGAGWYRYHALFADLLRASLRRRHPDLVPELHRRAAGWLGANGRRTDAEHHARLAGDWDHVGRLAADRWLGALLDDADPTPDPLAGAPAAAVATVPDLALVAAAAACRRGARDDADLHRGRLDELLGPPGDDPDTRRRLVDLAHGWAFGADDRARAAAAALLSDDCCGDPERAALVRRFARLRGAGLDIDRGNFDAAVVALRALADARHDDWIQAEANALLALLTAAGGNLARADQRATAVLAIDPAEVRSTALRAVHLARTIVSVQRGERRGAAAHLAAADAAAGPAVRPLDAAHTALHAALRWTAPGTGWLDSATASHPLAVQVLVAGGILEVVDPERRLVAVGGPAERAVVHARQHLARGAPESARAELDRCLAGKLGSVHVRTLVEARALAAVAAVAGGDGGDPRAHLRAALDLVDSTGVRAPLLDHAAALTDPLEREIEEVEHRALVLELVDALRRAPAGMTVENLTDRETAVLQYLPTLMSNAEIADGLHLSINTVKSHLKAVYRKLGVEGRRDAVLRGRELELI
jgi:LuxR family transcriptional regulator, maltose regulon positive regulatory protein